MENELIGKKVFITDKDSIFYNEWGIIKSCIGDDYYVAIANGTDSLPVFKRKEFTVPRYIGRD